MSITLDSKPFGIIQIEEIQVIEFDGGLFGFEKYSKFALIEESSESVFKWLQSLDEKELAFIVIQPELFDAKYKPIIPISELKTIELKSVSDALIMVIVSIPNDDPMQMTANLQGPILINKKVLKGRQFISRDENHPVRRMILENQKKVEPV
jgi:flagellar assembly factor FliW